MAVDFDVIYANRPAFDREPCYVAQELCRQIGRSRPVPFTDRRGIEFGAGLASNAAYLARRGYEMTCLDTSETAARKVTTAAYVQQLPIAYRVGDIMLFQPDGSYDAALLLKVLHFFPQQQQNAILQNIAAAIKPNGHVAIRAMTSHTGNCTVPGLIARGDLERRFSDWNITYSQKDQIVPFIKPDGTKIEQVYDDIIAQRPADLQPDL